MDPVQQTAQEAPTTTTTTASADEFAPIEINGQTFTLRGHVPTKGRGKGKLQCIFEPEKNPDGSYNYSALFDKIKEVVGEENWNKTIWSDVVRQACLDATNMALEASDDGKPHDEDYSTAFIESFISSTRRAGEHLKDIRERVAAIMAEVAPLLLRMNQSPNSPDYTPLSDEETLRTATLMEEFTTLNQKLEKKSRKGEAKKAKKEAVAA